MQTTPATQNNSTASGPSIKLIEDIPNETWLQEQIDYARERGPDRFGAPYIGKVTGCFENHIHLPLSLLISFTGQRNEQNNVRQNDLLAIKEILRDTGKLPVRSNGEEYVPFIVVAHDGSVRISEGNHRIMAADELAWQSMPTEIRYFDGGQRAQSGPLHPSKLASMMNFDDEPPSKARGPRPR